MKIKLILCIVLLLNICPEKSSASSQLPTIYLNGGLTYPTVKSSFKNFHNPGYHVELGIELKTISIFKLVGKVGRHRIYKNWTELYGDRVTGGDISLHTIGLDIHVASRQSKFIDTPYLLAGFGYASMKTDDIQHTLFLEPSFTFFRYDESSLYYNFGVGYQFDKRSHKFYFQLSYLIMKRGSSFISIVPFSIGVNF